MHLVRASNSVSRLQTGNLMVLFLLGTTQSVLDPDIPEQLDYLLAAVQQQFPKGINEVDQ